MSRLEELMQEMSGGDLEEAKGKKPSTSEIKKKAMYVAEHVFLDAFWRKVEREWRIPEHLFRKPEFDQLKEQFKNELAQLVARHFKRLFKGM
jgi:hypothetical protein